MTKPAKAGFRHPGKHRKSRLSPALPFPLGAIRVFSVFSARAAKRDPKTTSCRNEERRQRRLPAVTYSHPLGATEGSRPKPAKAGQRRAGFSGRKKPAFLARRRSRLPPASAGSFRGAQRKEEPAKAGVSRLFSGQKPASFGQKPALLARKGAGFWPEARSFREGAGKAGVSRLFPGQEKEAGVSRRKPAFSVFLL